jgi:beta-glucanase (GH16 family)
MVPPSAAAPATNWLLVWADEFDGPVNSQPDPSKWKFDLGSVGWGNHELQEYTSSLDNVSIDGDGHLAIRAVRLGPKKYTSGRLKTKGLLEVQNGKIEARIKIPFGRGIWPAFWMMGADVFQNGWPRSGEIDIMENIGREPALIHGTLHGPGYSGPNAISSRAGLPGNSRFADEFHIFGVEWSDHSIDFLLDGKPYARRTPASLPAGARWVFDHPFFLLLNVAVGGDWPKNPDTTTSFPQTMLVDWVRVWRRAAP